MVLTDEEQPLLRILSHDYESTQEERNVKTGDHALDFEPLDPEDPRNWPSGFKWGIVSMLALMAFTVYAFSPQIVFRRINANDDRRTFTCIGVVPVASKIVQDLDGKEASSANSALLVTIWELGEAAGPLLIAPLSEVVGRYPVMNACNIGFIAATILAVCSQNSNVFIAARMLTGLAVASNVLNPAIIGDIFESEQRGSAMSLIMLAPLIGGAIGPAISGAIAQTMGWRRILIIAAGLAILCELLFLTCFRETYRMAILKRRAAKARHAEGIVEAKGKHESAMKLWQSITRPFAVLFGSTVLMLLSLFASVAFSFFYVISVSLPGILVEKYHFTPAQTGSAFISFSKCSPGFRRVAFELTDIRHRFVLQRLGLQLHSGQNLCPTPWSRGQAGIPPATLHHRSALIAFFSHSIRMDRGIPAPRRFTTRIRGSDGLHASAYCHTAVRICCGCLRDVLGFCYDGRDRYQMSHGNVLAAGSWTTG
jgi:MFS family permease